MPRGGKRPGAGRKRTSPPTPSTSDVLVVPATAPEVLPPALDNPFSLTAKELLFVEHYFAAANFNASVAYQLAGFQSTPGSVRGNASRLIARDRVQQAVSARMAALVQQARTGGGVMNGDEAMERLSLYARADIGKVLGPEDPIAKLPDEIRLCVKSVRETKYGRVIELHDALHATETLGKAAGRLKETVEITNRVPLFALPADAEPDVSGVGP